MAYVAGEQILDDEYIAFASSSNAPYGYNHFAGTGSGVYGLGQTSLSLVNAGDTITAAQWNSLFTAMSNIANHTNDTLTSTTAVTAGDTIAVKAALEADLATLAASVAAGSPNAVALNTSLGTAATQSTEGWDNTSTQELTVTFASANAMRWFFNAGGRVRVTVGIVSPAFTNPKDTAFADLGTGIGNLDIRSQTTTRSGTTETDSTEGSGLALGFHDLTTSYQELIRLTSDNTNYTSNNIQISAKLDAAVGTATVMTIKMVATDPTGDGPYESTNPDSALELSDDTPRMVTTLFTLTPNSSEGLTAPNYGPASAAAPALAVLTNNSIT